MAPMMDFSALCRNPYTVDYFTVLRRQEVVNTLGESTVNVTQYPMVPGVVTAGQPSTLDRQANFQVAAKWIDITTEFRLYGESESAIRKTEYQPDIVQWHDNSYVVKTLSDFSSYGPGFVVAGCALIGAPTTPAGDGN